MDSVYLGWLDVRERKKGIEMIKLLSVAGLVGYSFAIGSAYGKISNPEDSLFKNLCAANKLVGVELIRVGVRLVTKLRKS